MHHSSPVRTDRTAGNPLAGAALGFLAATAMAAAVLAAGHGLLLAFLAYSFSGALILLATIAWQLTAAAALKCVAAFAGGWAFRAPFARA